MFDGVIVMAGAVANGAAIRAAEVLGADLAYLGTRFIASRESRADDSYKAMLVAEDATGLASGMLLYRWRLAPGETREVALVAPLDGPAVMPANFDISAATAEAERAWGRLMAHYAKL